MTLLAKRFFRFVVMAPGVFGESLTAIAKLVPDATLVKGLSVHYSGG
jgi:hypothetical protein